MQRRPANPKEGFASAPAVTQRMLSPRQHLRSLLARASASALDVQETLPLSLVAAAAQGDHKAVAQWLATDGSVDAAYNEDPSIKGSTMLMFSSHAGHMRIVELLIDSGASLNCKTSAGGTALMEAASAGHDMIVRRLLESGAAPSAAALRIAQTSSHTKCANVISEYMQAKALPRALVAAAVQDDRGSISAWLAAGGHVDATFDDPDGSMRGTTLLMFASHAGHERLVELLISHGAVIDLENSNGGTALMEAVAARWRGSKRHVGVMRRLLKAGAKRATPPVAPDLLARDCHCGAQTSENGFGDDGRGGGDAPCTPMGSGDVSPAQALQATTPHLKQDGTTTSAASAMEPGIGDEPTIAAAAGLPPMVSLASASSPGPPSLTPSLPPSLRGSSSAHSLQGLSRASRRAMEMFSSAEAVNALVLASALSSASSPLASPTPPASYSSGAFPTACPAPGEAPGEAPGAEGQPSPGPSPGGGAKVTGAPPSPEAVQPDSAITPHLADAEANGKPRDGDTELARGTTAVDRCEQDLRI